MFKFSSSIFFLGICSSLFAQVTPPIDKALIDQVKISALESPEGVSGDVIAKDMNPALTPGPDDQNCPTDDKDKKKDKDKELVLIFTGEINSRPSMNINGKSVESPNLSNYDPNDSEYKDLLSKDAGKIMGLANANSQENKDDPLTHFGALLLVGASQMYQADKVNDIEYNNKVNQMMADKIKAMNFTHDQLVQLIASMSEALYDNYNNPRNVTPEGDNNPRYWTSQANGLFSQNTNMGGVCDDISFLGCQLYQAVNPNDDCLTMHSSGAGGTQHFVMLLGNKGTRDYTTINGGFVENANGLNYLSMDPASPIGADGGINIRLNRVKDGKHESIAVLKNEYGQWMEKVMDKEGKPGSSVVKDIDGTILQNLGAAFEKNQSQIEESKKSSVKYGVNQGILSNGTQMVAVYALIDKSTPKKRVGVGFGYNYSQFNTNQLMDPYSYSFNNLTRERSGSMDYNNDIHRLHINPYYGFGNTFNVTKGNNEFKIHYLNGVYANLLAGVQVMGQVENYQVTDRNDQGEIVNQRNSTYSNGGAGIIFDGNLGFSEKLDVDLSNKKTGTEVKFNAQLTQELGPSDWTRTHGLQADFLGGMKNMTFFLNRVELNTQMKQKVGEGKSVLGGVQYLGSNVGQNLLSQIGFQFDIPKDMKLFIMTGYGAEFGGYKTNQNYLPVSNNTGVSLRAGVTTDKGVRVGAGVRYDSKSIQPVSGQVNATIPIGINKKTKKP